MFNSAAAHVPVLRRFTAAASFIGLGLLLVLGLQVQPFDDPDVFIHLRDGRYLFDHHLRFGTEPFAYTIAAKPFETVEWLFRFGAYLTWSLGGFNLLIVVKSLLMTAAIALLGLLTWRRWPNLGVVAGLLALALLSPATPLFVERPYVFTYLFLPFVLLLIEDYRRSGPEALSTAGKRLWFIPVLVIPWANLHPGFMVVFGFLGADLAQVAWDAWRRRDPSALLRMRTLGGISCAVFAAGAVNPMGFGLYTYSVGLLRSEEIMRHIQEWASPTWSGQPVFFVLLWLAWLAMALNWRRITLSDSLPLLAFSCLAVNSYRNIPLFCIAALPRLAADLQDLRRRFAGRISVPPVWRRRALNAGVGLLLVLLLAAVSHGMAFRLGQLPGSYPELGLRWIENNRFSGNLLTHDQWGGYTGWVTAGRVKVFMDGRLPAFGESLYRDYRRMIWGDADTCLPLLRQYRIEGILVSPKNDIRLFQQLWASGDWTLIYWDDVSQLYVRRQGCNQDLAGRFGFYAVDPKRQPYYDQQQSDLALTEIRRAQEMAADSFLPFFFEGDLCLRLGRPEESRRALADALRLAPEHAPSYLALGLLDRQSQRLEEAERDFLRVVGLHDDRMLYALACYQLGSMLSADPSRHPEALRWAHEAARTLPDWDDAKKLLAELER